jgi:signal transduction histidine kinase
VTLTATDDLRIEVRDNGVGLNASASDAVGLGLANLAKRARSLDGTFEVDLPEGGGTRVTWQVPAH